MRSVEEMVFLAACRGRGLLADVPPDELRQAAIDRFGLALFQCEPGGDANSVSVTRSSRPDTLALFDRLPVDADMLGPVHDRLLGLCLKPSGAGPTRAARTSAVAKANGVFYTPRFVTDYMAARAIESLDEGRPGDGQREPPRILDPACGCGAFLLAAYRRLRQQMLGDAPAGAPNWLGRRRAILERLHGVDLDGQAVLAARRALWLEAAAEPAGPVSPSETSIFFRTIRQGNALEGSAFDSPPCPFDLVLGNPPYRRELGAKAILDEIARTEFGRRWRTARMDLWYYFAHRAIELLGDGGVLSLVVSGYWTAGRGAAKLVDHLRREMHVEEIVDLGRLPVFDHVAGRHLILRARKAHAHRATTVVKRPGVPAAPSAEPLLTGGRPMVVFEKTSDELFHDGRIDLEPVAHEALGALARATPLGRLGRVRQGIAENPATVTAESARLLGDVRAGQGVFVLTAEEVDDLHLSEEERSLLRPYHLPRDVARYRVAPWPSRILIYSTVETCPDLRAFPSVGRHLARFRPIMEARRETRLGRRAWWHLHWPRDASLWTADKILCVQMAPRPTFAAATGPAYVNFSVNVFVPDRSTREHLLYLTAMLNSRVLEDWFRHHAKRRGVGLEIGGGVFAQAPIRRIDFGLASDRRAHDELVDLAREMGRMRDCPPRAAEFAATQERIDAIVARLCCVHPYGASRRGLRRHHSHKG